MAVQERTLVVDYEALEEVLGHLRVMNELAVEMRDLLTRHTDNLAGGLWQGQGASSYYREFDEVIKPALDRLVDGTEQAQSTIRAITGETQSLEEVIAAHFLEMIGYLPGFGAFARPPEMMSRALLAFEDSMAYKISSGAFNLHTLADNFAQASKSFPTSLKNFLANPRLSTAGTAASWFGAGLNLVDFAENPHIQSGADLGASAIGLVPHPAAKVFAASYGLTSTFVTPYTTEPLAGFLQRVDVFDAGASIRNYPQHQINYYKMTDQPMPMDVARHVYRGLLHSDRSQAEQFVANYTTEHGMTVGEFRRGLGIVLW